MSRISRLLSVTKGFENAPLKSMRCRNDSKSACKCRICVFAMSFLRNEQNALIRTARAVQRPWLSAERAVDGDFVESGLENGELLIVELREEQFRDPAQVDGSGLGQARHAGVG